MRTRNYPHHYCFVPFQVDEKLQTPPKTIVLCDIEPLSIEGLRALLAGCEDLRLAGAETSMVAALELATASRPNVAIIDKAFGTHAIVDWIRRMRALGAAALIWGIGICETEARRLVQAGATGVVRKTCDVPSLLAAIRAVASGSTWVEECLMGDVNRGLRTRHSALTGRELQVLELVEQGMRNKDIGRVLGIQAGTVKIHLRHIFEKTGIRGRYGLALSGLKEKGLLSLPTM
jgi:DNA-binding NarL/FixJ family response regulator